MKKIPLTKGYFALVDDEDFEYLNQFKWHYNNYGYATRRIYKNKKSLGMITMHKELLKAKKGKEIDHINNNTLDNRKENLRNVTRSQNMMNTKLRRTNTSGYKGVCYDKRRKKWNVEIMLNYKKIYIGRFITKEEAALAYNQAAKKYFGEYAVLNQL